MNMKSLFGTANKGIGKLKGFIFGGNSSTEESNPPQSSPEPQPKENSPQPKTTTANTQNQNNPVQEKSPQKEDSKNNTIMKSSKGQFDFSEEDDDEEAKPKKTQESESADINAEYTEPEEDYWKIAHRLYLKNSMVDIEPLPYVPFIKVKKNDSILSIMGLGNSILGNSIMGFGNKKLFREVKYFAVFDEHFLYMINMTTKDNNQNNFFKKIGNHYDLTKVSNIEIKDDEILPGKKLIKIVFLLDNDNNNFSTINKEFHFEKNDAIKFFSILKFYLKKYGVPLIFKDDKKEGDEKDEEEEDEEEEEEEDENDNKEEEKKDENKENKEEKDENKKEEVKEEDKKEKEKEEVKEEKKDEEKKEEEKKEEVGGEKKDEEKKEEKKDEEVKKEEEKKEEEKKEEVKEEKKEDEKKDEEKKEEEKKEEEKKE